MFLHLGGENAVYKKDIIGIFDLDTAGQSRRTRAFLSAAEKNELVINTTEDLPKSFILCESSGEPKVYLSQMSTATLVRRSESSGME